VTVTLPYPPTVNTYWRHWRGRVLISAKGRAYKRTAALAAMAGGMKRHEGPVAVTMSLYRPKRVGDLDNCMKALLDSLAGVAWDDDSQIVRIVAERFDDKHNPRAEVTVTVESHDR
jgi:crossover junction endodeoxyribonuclease RusA